MKAWQIIVGILVILVILAIAVISWGIRVNNTIIAKEQTAEESWGNVQSSYQRRADLIPNLVEMVKITLSAWIVTLEYMKQVLNN